MPSTIKSIDAQSPLLGRVRAGDVLLRINGHEIADVLDYRYYSAERRLSLELLRPNGTEYSVHLKKGEYEDPGLDFDDYLMDRPRACRNRCLFCFVDQLPKGLRKTLYFKDDDARLSFLTGSYITLTNLSPREIERIISLRISPINVSVHATEPELRARLLGNPAAAGGYELMKRLAAGGIVMNCQIVCCPGINDGAALRRTMEDLAALYPGVGSVSVVPVGLTGHREGLYPLAPFDRLSAERVIDAVEDFGEKCLRQKGSRIFFCADELYLKGGRPIPPDEYYEDYPQLENGVGLLRLLEVEFVDALGAASLPLRHRPFSIATGVSAAPFLRELLSLAGVEAPVYPIVNDFFGHTIDVAGLVTGGDLISQLRGRPLGERLLIPYTMLRHGEGIFLDDVTLEDARRELGVPLVPVARDGEALLRAITEGM